MRPCNKNDLTAEDVRSRLDYDATTGIFTWRVAPRRGVYAGAVAGHVNVRGYVELRFDKNLYLAHRLAWLWVTGSWPLGEVDHRNSVRGDNRFDNLRDVSHSLNQQNLTSPQKNNTTGFLGVYKRRDRWRSSIQIGANIISLGTFDTPEQAHNAYVSAKRRLHAGCTL